MTPGAGSESCVSVVVPTYRRPDLLTRCLEALGRQDLRCSRYEVIVADDGGGDAVEVVERAARDLPMPVRCDPGSMPRMRVTYQAGSSALLWTDCTSSRSFKNASNF